MRLVEIAENLATSVLATSLFVIHNSVAGRQDDEAKLAAGKQVINPLFHLGKLDVETRTDDAALVQATIQLDDDLAGTVVVDDFKLANVAVFLHDHQELDNNLRARTDEHLALAALLGIVDALESIVQHANTDHDYMKAGISYGSVLEMGGQ